MSKVIQALLSGMFFTFILDFFIFLGIKINYIDTNNINEYYNVLFSDHQNIYVFIFFTILIGYVSIYRSNKLSFIVLLPLIVISFSTLISSVGLKTGELLLKRSNVTINTLKHSYTGDIIYNARKEIVFYDYRLDKILHLNKNKIIGEY